MRDAPDHRHKKCAKKQSRKIHISWVIFQIISKPETCVKKLLKIKQNP